MPSKNGFGNLRTPMKKVGYGSAMHYKNPVKMTAAQETLPENLKAGIRAKEEKDSGLKMYDKASPNKTKLGRWLMGRKKQVTEDGTVVITDKRGGIVKTKTADGTKTKYKKGNRPQYRKEGQNVDSIVGGIGRN
tara:strand:+ start:26 stop:427 length:402 start_codon:yes stop_codon:yes gene_type:complete